MRSQYEQLIEYIINDETDKAKELFHNLVVAKSRDIYNEIVAEEIDEEVEETEDMDEEAVEEDSVEENFGMEMEAGDSEDQTDDMMQDIEADHDGMGSDEEDMDMGGDDMDMGDAEGGEDMEDRVMDLEDALDELKAEFEKLMAQEKDEPEHQDHAEEGVVREYVEKVSKPSNSEGQGVGAGSIGGSTNTKGIVAGKNDMGGKVVPTGKSEHSDPNGTSAPKAPKSGNMPHSGQYLNTPGGDAGKKGFSNAKKPVSKEASGTNKTNILP